MGCKLYFLLYLCIFYDAVISFLRSAWTDNPEEREKRARGEIEEKPEEEDQLYLVNKARYINLLLMARVR